MISFLLTCAFLYVCLSLFSLFFIVLVESWPAPKPPSARKVQKWERQALLQQLRRDPGVTWRY